MKNTPSRKTQNTSSSKSDISIRSRPEDIENKSPGTSWKRESNPPDAAKIWSESLRQIQAGKTINLKKLRTYLEIHPDLSVPSLIARHLLDCIEGKIKIAPNRPQEDPFDKSNKEYWVFHYVNELLHDRKRWSELLTATRKRKTRLSSENYQNQILDLRQKIDSSPTSKEAAYRILSQKSHELLGEAMSPSSIKKHYLSYQESF